MLSEFAFFKCLAKKVWQINRSALIVSIILDGFSLTNHERFIKFTKLFRCMVYVCVVEME